MKQNALFFTTTSYGGMGMNSYSVLNTFLPSDNVFYFVVEQDEGYYHKHIKVELLPKTKIVHFKPGRLKQLCSLFQDSLPPYYNELLSFCKEKKISVIFQLSSPSYPRMVTELKKQGIKYIANVHDLHPHLADKAFYKEWKQRVIYNRIYRCYKLCEGLVTNELGQFEEMQRLYPNKYYAYHELPTSVTKEIIEGNMIPHELKEVNKKFILFFGRIEGYKGVSLLYNTFLSHHDLNEKYALVIAGQGDIMFKRCLCELKKNIYVLNRYIDDAEVRYLYENSACVVYPYTSITQTGILSFPFYFGVPCVTSNLKAFSDKLLGEKLGSMFENGNEDDLYLKIKTILDKDNSNMIKAQRTFYSEVYENQSFRKPLLELFEKVSITK